MARRVTWDEMLERFRKAHGDTYDYSLVEYKGVKKPVTIIGPMGEFSQVAEVHAKGHGDPRVALAKQSADQFYTTEIFIEKADVVHSNFYDYSSVEYVNSKTHVVINCLLHGEFSQTPSHHLFGKGCAQCGWDRSAALRTKDVGDFISDAKSVHGDLYDYSAFVYRGAFVLGTVICSKHGEFSCDPSNHLAGKGCPRCGNIVSSCNVAIHKLFSDAGVSAVLEFRMGGKKWDVGLPDHKIVVEHHGLIWHGTKFMTNVQAKNLHESNRLLAESLGFRYVAVYGDEWANKRELSEAYLLSLVGIGKTVYARKCKVVTVSKADAGDFYDAHHFMGRGLLRGDHMGLVDAGGVLLSVMSIGQADEIRGRSGLSLSRFATVKGTRVVGGASRLFKALAPDSPVVSYVDLDKFEGGVYKTLGFELDEYIGPDYFINPAGRNVRLHKSQVRRSNLAKRDGFDPALSEFENCQAMQLYRVYHSGRLRMVWQP